MAAQIVTDTQVVIDSGLAAASAQLVSALNAQPVVADLVHKLIALRDRYTFEKMQLTRLQINTIDSSVSVQQAVQALATANSALSAIQNNAAATTQWATLAATTLTSVAGAVTALEGLCS